jgi:hypothetical protein
VRVDIDGTRVTAFDPAGKGVPKDRQWFEPKREPRRPGTSAYKTTTPATWFTSRNSAFDCWTRGSDLSGDGWGQSA